MGTITYLAICPILTPEVLTVIAKNSAIEGHRFSFQTGIGWAILSLGLAAIFVVTKRRSFPFRFAFQFGWIFVGLLLIYYVFSISLFPQTHRYHLESDLGFCGLIAIAVWHVPSRTRVVLLSIAVLLAIPQIIRMRRVNRAMIQPIDMYQTAEYRTSRWIQDHLPGTRVMVSGDFNFWFNLFSDNPQLSGGHDPYSPNFVQRAAVFTIYTGMNAGDRDAEYSIFWLKAFGTHAIHVPRAASREHYHPFTHPDKFEGVLPKLWEENAIYSVPTHSKSLAHVVPVGAIATQTPNMGSILNRHRLMFGHWTIRHFPMLRSIGFLRIGQ